MDIMVTFCNQAHIAAGNLCPLMKQKVKKMIFFF